MVFQDPTFIFPASLYYLPESGARALLNHMYWNWMQTLRLASAESPLQPGLWEAHNKYLTFSCLALIIPMTGKSLLGYPGTCCSCIQSLITLAFVSSPLPFLKLSKHARAPTSRPSSLLFPWFEMSAASASNNHRLALHFTLDLTSNVILPISVFLAT